MTALKGAYAAAITPIGPDGDPDAGKLTSYCLRLIEEGLTGVAPCGTTGEGASLPLSFRAALPEVFAKAGLPAERVILGTGAASVDDAVLLTRAALEAGYTSLLVLPPFYTKNVSDEGIFASYARLMDRIGDDRLRLYLYHFPQMSAVPIPIPVIQRLREAYGAQIAGLKDSSGDYEGTLKFVGALPDFDVFPSSEAVLLDGISKGCAGVISATTNCAPSLVGKVLAEKLPEDQARLASIREAVSSFPLVAAVKQIEAWKSSDPDWCGVLPPKSFEDGFWLR